MSSLDEAYRALDGYFKIRAGADNKMGMTFMVYFKSIDVVFQAFDGLSFAKVENGNVKMSEDFSIKTLIMKDLNKIALVYFIGYFTKDQAKEVILKFSKKADHGANEKYLAEDVSKLAIALKEKGGGGGVVWTQWLKLNKSRLRFWK